jgi:hypothetical protein
MNGIDLDFCKAGFYRSGIEEGKPKEWLDKTWQELITDDATMPGYTARDHNLFREKAGLEPVTEIYSTANRRHLGLVLPVYYKQPRKWRTENDDYKKIYNISVKLLGPHFIQFWHGGTNRGKTGLVVHVLKHAVKQGLRAHYMHAMELYGLFRNYETKGADGVSRSIEGHVKELDEYDIIAIDEFNATTLTDVQRNGVAHFIRWRLDREKKTVIISNHTEEGLKNLIPTYSVLANKVTKNGKGCRLPFDIPEWTNFRQDGLHDEKK